jgi:hypothetical protein
MKSKLPHVKYKSRPVIVIAALTLLLTVAGVMWASVGLASKGLIIAPPTESEPVLLGSSESKAEETASSASCSDSDTLDMEGVWMMTQGAPPGITLDSSNHWAPAGPSLWTYYIRLRRVGPNEHGGQRFVGEWRDYPALGTFYGDTFYGGQGVQLVQMRFEENTSCGRYYKLLSGKHQLYSSDPTRVEVLGGWVDVGYLGAASGYNGSFVMVKVAP